MVRVGERGRAEVAVLERLVAACLGVGVGVRIRARVIMVRARVRVRVRAMGRGSVGVRG